MAKTEKTKFNRDDPELWRAWDDWNDARHYAALKGHFNLHEDGKVGVAFGKNDIAFMKKMTKKRLNDVGVTKPKFKKPKKLGQAGMDEPGTRAHGLRLYERHIFGVPKPMPKPKKKKKVEKAIKEKAIKEKATKKIAPTNSSPSDPGLPPPDAYDQARKQLKKDEILLYLTHRGEDSYTATCYSEKTRKKRNFLVTGEYVPNFTAQPKKKVQKAVKKGEPKKSKKKSSRY